MRSKNKAGIAFPGCYPADAQDSHALLVVVTRGNVHGITLPRLPCARARLRIGYSLGEVKAMPYILAFQVFCGCFSAYVAAQKGRSAILWLLAGALLPVFGVVWILLLEGRGKRPRTPSSGGRAPSKRRRPRRCSGEFTSDCLGCSYFRRRLFSVESSEDVRGYCGYYGKDLIDDARSPTPPM